MKVLLINPVCPDLRITDDDASFVPIGLYYLAAGLLDQGVSARILNLAAVVRGDRAGGPGRETVPGSLDVFRAALEQEKPDIIGFSVTNPGRISAMDCARLAKDLLPGVVVIFGGPAPTFMAAHLFRACAALDIAVRGEGEQTLSALVRALQDPAPDLAAIKGLVFRQQDGSLTDTGLPDPVEDLDSLPRPSRHFRYQHIAMSRGCPGKCTFCGSPRFWGTSRVRRHSVSWFFEEINTLAKRGVTHFFISDDTFTCDRSAVIGLCERIIAEKLPITWNAISRVDYIDEEMLSAMRRAGCIQISFGIESGSPAIRKILGKPVDEADCTKAFELARSYGIMPRAYFIYGSPGETDTTIEASVTLMEKLAPLSAVFYLLVLFPGTHLYTRAREQGLVSDDIWFQTIEDLPWFELSPELDFAAVKAFGDRLRDAFFSGLETAVETLTLKDEKALYPFHADFLSRLAMTFSHGEYAADPRIRNPERLARRLFEKALSYAPDPRAYLGLAMCRQRDRDLSGAHELFTRGLALFPDHRDLRVGLGVCRMNLEDFKGALEAFKPFDKDPALSHYIKICNTRITP